MITKLERTGHFVNLKRLDKDSIIVDAGACLGALIDDIRSYNQTSHSLIIAIEPHPGHAKRLLCRNDENLVVWQRALVGNEEKLEFYSSYYPGWGSTQRPPPNPHMSYQVKTIKINKIFTKFNIPRIDYLKMVIGGDEKRVLDAMSLETAGKIKQISVEFHKQYGATGEYVEDRFKALGFKIRATHYKEIFGERK